MNYINIILDNTVMVMTIKGSRSNVATIVLALVASYLVYSNSDSSYAQNQTQQDNETAGPLAQLSGRAQDVFNGTNQSGGPIAEFGETLQETFR
ncbi:MAG: hypothetical protein ACRD5J_05405 [Nitrososphaeraceae archaeon]